MKQFYIINEPEVMRRTRSEVLKMDKLIKELSL